MPEQTDTTPVNPDPIGDYVSAAVAQTRATSDSEHRFTDPVSGQEVTLLLDGTTGPGVEHGDCATLAEVFPHLDAFYCDSCRWNGRISGAWYVAVCEANEVKP